MPEKRTLQRAKADKKRGNAPSTQAGEFVREEIDHVREGKHGARSPQQAIAIGLSKARRAGVKVAGPKKGSAATKKRAASDSRAGAKKGTAKKATKKTSAKRSRATTKALKKEGDSSASRSALSKHAKQVAANRKKAS